MMTPSDLVVPPGSQLFTLPLTSHIACLAVPLSLFLGDTADDGEPRLAKKYGLDSLGPIVQQQLASEARNHPLFTSFSRLNVFLRW